jgi:hypothetical protein
MRSPMLQTSRHAKRSSCAAKSWDGSSPPLAEPGGVGRARIKAGAFRREGHSSALSDARELVTQPVERLSPSDADVPCRYRRTDQDSHSASSH